MQTFTSIRDIVDQNSRETLKEHELSQFDFVLEKAGLDEYFADLQKAIAANPLHKTELLEKGRKDLSKLVQKTVTDKRGHQRKVWVKVAKDAPKTKQKRSEDQPKTASGIASNETVKKILSSQGSKSSKVRQLAELGTYSRKTIAELTGAHYSQVHSILKNTAKSEPKAEVKQEEPKPSKTPSTTSNPVKVLGTSKELEEMEIAVHNAKIQMDYDLEGLRDRRRLGGGPELVKEAKIDFERSKRNYNRLKAEYDSRFRNTEDLSREQSQLPNQYSFGRIQDYRSAVSALRTAGFYTPASGNPPKGNEPGTYEGDDSFMSIKVIRGATDAAKILRDTKLKYTSKNSKPVGYVVHDHGGYLD